MGIYTTNSESISDLKYANLKRNTVNDIRFFYGMTETSCVTSTYFDMTNMKINCAADYEYSIDESKYSCLFSFYKEIDGTCDTTKDACPLGFFDKTTDGDNCSCSSNDKKLMLAVKDNQNRITCKSKKKFFIYILFYFSKNFEIKYNFDL